MGGGGMWSTWGFNGTWGPFGGKPAVHIHIMHRGPGRGGVTNASPQPRYRRADPSLCGVAGIRRIAVS